ncbi:MAG: Uncharacterized protein G01um10148_356 [Parcubacteria group bacterium Gr01-1014_8]|nr:MAG: Uncharacterized protein G01um10148_356 [Parcubacteria group bacterium Gr01-1014_8]
MKFRLSVYIWPIIAAAALLGGAFFYVNFSSRAEAAAIVETCKKEPDNMFCYEREVPKLYSSYSIPELFEFIREIRRLDPSYQFCHVLAHKLGEEAVAEDPSRWLDMIPLNPRDGMCSNGFIHGVIVGRFRNDTLDKETLEKTIPDLARACEPRANWSPSSLDQAICYHGMGHLFMFITNADMRLSLDTCARISRSATGDFMRVCREGVFMQTYQPLEPDDFALLELLPEKPTKENYRRLCAAYANDPEEGACLREAWPFFRTDILKGTGAISFCSGQPTKEEEEMCYESASTIIGRQLLGNDEKASAACDALPQKWQSICYIAAAQALLEEDRATGKAAISLCERGKNGVADTCLKTLAMRANWIFSSGAAEKDAFCEALPRFKEECDRRR